MLLALIATLSMAAPDTSGVGAFRASWTVDGFLAPLSLATFGAGTWSASRLAPYDGGFERSRLLPWDRPFAGWRNDPADLSSTLLCGAAAYPVVLSVSDWSGGRLEIQDLEAQSLMVAEIVALESGTENLAKGMGLWPRPMAVGKSSASADDASSFWSGHAAGAFAAAVFAGEWFEGTHPGDPDAKWVWGVGLGLASTVAVLRITSGRHYPTDVFAGAAAGSLIGWAVPFLHRSGCSNKVLVGLAPIPGGLVAVARW